MFIIRVSLILVLVALPLATHSFLPSQYKPFDGTSLNAKGATKRKKKGTATKSSGGGFGKVVVSTPSKKRPTEDDDYAAFPALDAKVKDTLIPSHESFSEVAQDLPPEIYDRLTQIYGFENFNYPADDKNQERGAADSGDMKEESISFNDLLSADEPSSTATIKPLSDFSDLLKSTPSSSTPAPAATTSDFSDLISSASGGETNTDATSISLDSSSDIHISNLKPFSKFRVLHVDPMVLAIDDFFTPEECDAYVDLCKNPKKRTSNNDMPMMSRSKTVGKDSLAKAQRTSTTWFHHFKSVPELVAKGTRLMGLDTIQRWEEPQTVRYQQSEKFTWHLDALAPSDSLDDSGGQRVATLLVYLTDIGENNGGSTAFRDLGGEEGKYLKVTPKKGSALLFFPAAGNIPNTPFDIRTLHAGEALSDDATDEKWIAQMWLRENMKYKPSAPPGNSHSDAIDSINEFCTNSS